MRHRFTAKQGGRLDKLIAEHTPLSRKRAKAIIKRGGAWIDGQRARFESHSVPPGAVVELRTTAPTRAAVEIPTIYREAGILVVDKPAGLPSQPARDGGRQHLYGILSGQERYVGLHHRLDTPASGLILLTLDRALNRPISAAIQSGAIRRRYLAVVLGDPGASGHWSSTIDGKAASSTFRRLSTSGQTSVLEVELQTGRTHQIRRQCVEAGCPLLGDRRYGGAAGRVGARLALHAWKLTFHHPRLNREVAVSAPIPEALVGLMEQAGWTDGSA